MEQERLYTYLPTLQGLLGVEGEDPKLLFAMRASLAEILSYIGHDTLPESLVYPWLLVTAGQWQSGVFNGEAPLTSLQRGDVTWDYATLTQRNADGFYGQRNALNAHRKLRCFHGKTSHHH